MLLAGVIASLRTEIASAGVLSATEQADAVVATGVLRLSGALAVTEASDTIVATALPPNTAALSIAEDGDSLAAAGQQIPPNYGVLDIVEAGDTLAAFAGGPIFGAATITEAEDTVAATGASLPHLSGTLAVTEAGDTIAATGQAIPDLNGVLSVTEAGDTLAATGEEPSDLNIWNSADKNAGITLSNGDLTATTTSGSGYRGVRGEKVLDGTHLLIMSVGNIDANDYAFGIANLSASLSNWVGNDNNSIGYYGTATVWRGGSNIGSVPSGNYSSGAAPELEVDAVAQTVRFRVSSSGTWSSAFSISALGAGPYRLIWATDSTTNDITISS